MVKERDEKSGRYTASVADDEIVWFIRDRSGVATSDVAERFDYERPSAYRRLKSLEDAGRVTSREIGNSLLWEATEHDADETHASRDDASTDGAETMDTTHENKSRSAPPHDAERESTRKATVADAARDAVDHDDRPGHVDVEDAARAYMSVIQYLDGVETGSRRTIVEHVMPKHALGYDAPDLPIPTGERYRGAWWRRVIKPALDADPAVEYDHGRNGYRLVDEYETTR